MLRDAEGDFRKELEAGKKRWRQGHPQKTVEESHIRAVLSQWTGVPVSDPTQHDRKALEELEQSLERTVLGQEQAVKAVAGGAPGKAGAEGPQKAGGVLFAAGSQRRRQDPAVPQSGPDPVRQFGSPHPL